MKRLTMFLRRIPMIQTSVAARQEVTVSARRIAALVLALTLASGAATMAAMPQEKTKKQAKQEPKAGTKYDTADEAFRAGVAYLELKETAKSQEPFEQALKLAKDDKYKIRVYQALLQAYRALPEPDKATEALEFIIDKSDRSAERSLARTSLMSFIHQRGKEDWIIKRYEDALKKDPNNKTALYILSDVYDKLKENPKRAAEVMERLATVTKQQGGEVDVGAQAKLAAQYVKAGKVKEGAELFEKIADLDPKLAAAHWKDAAMAWLEVKDKERALAAAKASAASMGETRGELLEHFWHKALADIFLEVGEAKLAIPHYEKAIEKTNIAGYLSDCRKKLAEAREKAGPDAETTTGKSGSIDLNRATLDELKSVAGITEQIAVQIIDRRKTKPFKSVSELIELDAVDKSLLAKIRPHLKVEGEK